MIGPQTRLILLDCFETLVELDGVSYRARKGVIAFLEHFRAKLQLAVVSDATETLVRAALTQATLDGYFRRVYHRDNALEQLPDGRLRKRLDVPLLEHGLNPDQAVFIGDSPLDAEAALRFQVPFIRVPRSEDRAFTFAMLIAGPSRYDSAEFSATFLDQYRNDRGRGPDGR